MLQRIIAQRFELAGLVALGVFSSTLLWWPQFGDQALFGEGGRVLAAGGVYWRDFWDVKQPGIFWFYGLGQRLGGAVLGVRLLELAAALLAGLVVARIGRDWRVRPSVLAVSPLLVLGPYVLSGDANGVGQVEGLMTLPMLVQYLALGRAVRAGRGRTAVAWGLLAGLGAGAVAVLKLMYLPLGLVLLLGALLEHQRVTRSGWGRRVLTSGTGWLAGVVLLLASVAGYAVEHKVAGLALYSTVTAPREQLATGLLSVSAALDMLRALVLAITVTGPLAAVALSAAVRRRQVVREAGLVAWAMAAALLAAPQLPTTYRVLVVLPPVGLLAVLGLDRLATGARGWSAVGRRAAAMMLLLAAVPLSLGVIRLGAALASQGWSLSDGVRLAVGDRIGGSPMVAPAQPMRQVIAPGTAIYVLGDPVIYRVLDAHQAIEMNGWGPEIMSDRMWAETVRELSRSRPAWVFVQAEYQPYVDRVPGLTGVLRQSYVAVPEPGGGGTWWRATDPGLPAPSPEGNRLAAGG